MYVILERSYKISAKKDLLRNILLKSNQSLKLYIIFCLSPVLTIFMICQPIHPLQASTKFLKGFLCKSEENIIPSVIFNL